MEEASKATMILQLCAKCVDRLLILLVTLEETYHTRMDQSIRLELLFVFRESLRREAAKCD